MPNLYLPSVSTGPTPPVQGESDTFQQQLFELMSADPWQQRKACVWSRPVALVAQARCDLMGRQGWFVGHLDDRGHGPNWWLRQAGIRLPDGYGQEDDSNNVESLGLNYQTPAECWQGWLDSSAHRAHVLGLYPSYAEQVAVGIGFWVGAEQWPTYWCVITIPTEATR